MSPPQISRLFFIPSLSPSSTHDFFEEEEIEENEEEEEDNVNIAEMIDLNISIHSIFILRGNRRRTRHLSSSPYSPSSSSSSFSSCLSSFSCLLPSTTAAHQRDSLDFLRSDGRSLCISQGPPSFLSSFSSSSLAKTSSHSSLLRRFTSISRWRDYRGESFSKDKKKEPGKDVASPCQKQDSISTSSVSNLSLGSSPARSFSSSPPSCTFFPTIDQTHESIDERLHKETSSSFSPVLLASHCSLHPSRFLHFSSSPNSSLYQGNRTASSPLDDGPPLPSYADPRHSIGTPENSSMNRSPTLDDDGVGEHRDGCGRVKSPSEDSVLESSRLAADERASQRMISSSSSSSSPGHPHHLLSHPQSAPLPCFFLRLLSFLVAFLSVFLVHFHMATLSLLIRHSPPSPPPPPTNSSLSHSETIYFVGDAKTNDSILQDLNTQPSSTSYSSSSPSPSPHTSSPSPVSHQLSSKVSPSSSSSSSASTSSSPAITTRRRRPPSTPLRNTRETPSFSSSSSRTRSSSSSQSPASSSLHLPLSASISFSSSHPSPVPPSSFSSAFVPLPSPPSPLHEVSRGVSSLSSSKSSAFLSLSPSPFFPFSSSFPWMEDLLIASSLFLQALGCLIYGASADSKGRRWSLSRSLKVFSFSSLSFTFLSFLIARLEQFICASREDTPTHLRLLLPEESGDHLERSANVSPLMASSYLYQREDHTSDSRPDLPLHSSLFQGVHEEQASSFIAPSHPDDEVKNGENSTETSQRDTHDRRLAAENLPYSSSAREKKRVKSDVSGSRDMNLSLSERRERKKTVESDWISSSSSFSHNFVSSSVQGANKREDPPRGDISSSSSFFSSSFLYSLLKGFLRFLQEIWNVVFTVFQNFKKDYLSTPSFSRLAGGFPFFLYLLSTFLLPGMALLFFSFTAVASGGILVISHCLCFEAASEYHLTRKRSSSSSPSPPSSCTSSPRLSSSSSSSSSANVESTTVASIPDSSSSFLPGDVEKRSKGGERRTRSRREKHEERKITKEEGEDGLVHSSSSHRTCHPLSSPLLDSSADASPSSPSSSPSSSSNRYQSFSSFFSPSRSFSSSSSPIGRTYGRGTRYRCLDRILLSISNLMNRFSSFFSVSNLRYLRHRWLPTTSSSRRLSFSSSPYMPIAYLLIVQTGAHLFLPVLLTSLIFSPSKSLSSSMLTPLPSSISSFMPTIQQSLATEFSSYYENTSASLSHLSYQTPFSFSLETERTNLVSSPFSLFCLCFAAPVPLAILLIILVDCFLIENPYFCSQKAALYRALRLYSYYTHDPSNVGVDQSQTLPSSSSSCTLVDQQNLLSDSTNPSRSSTRKIKPSHPARGPVSFLSSTPLIQASSSSSPPRSSSSSHAPSVVKNSVKIHDPSSFSSCPSPSPSSLSQTSGASPSSSSSSSAHPTSPLATSAPPRLQTPRLTVTEGEENDGPEEREEELDSFSSSRDVPPPSPHHSSCSEDDKIKKSVPTDNRPKKRPYHISETTLETPLLSSSSCGVCTVKNDHTWVDRAPPQLSSPTTSSIENDEGMLTPPTGRIDSSSSSSSGISREIRCKGIFRSFFLKVVKSVGYLICSCCYYGTFRCCFSCVHWDLWIAVKESVRVYRQYLNTGKRPLITLLGVTIPAAFIAAAFYLRGVFRFLLLDCVVLEHHVPSSYSFSSFEERLLQHPNERHNSSSSSFSPTQTPFPLLNNGGAVSSSFSFLSYPIASYRLAPSNLFSASSLPANLSSSIIGSDDHLFKNSLLSSPIFFLSSMRNDRDNSNTPTASSMDLLLSLLSLSIPVFSVRLVMSLFPIVLLSYLPPKPLQMIGCILCGFMAFGIGLTLTTLKQHFPHIPPISASTTASLLYEIGFCWCSFAPLFTSALLPLQGFHTAVRGGATAASYACSRGFTALVMIAVQVWFTLPSTCGFIGINRIAQEDMTPSRSSSSYLSSSSSTMMGVGNSSLFKNTTNAHPVQGKEEEEVLSQDQGGLLSFSFSQGKNNTEIDEMVGKEHLEEREMMMDTTMNDPCSANAVTVSIIACGFYVIAAALTLMITTHVRLPKVIFDQAGEQGLLFPPLLQQEQQQEDDGDDGGMPTETKKSLPGGRLEKKKGGWKPNRKERRQQQLRRLASQEWTVQWIEGEEEGVVVILDRLYIHRIKQAASGVNLEDGLDEEDDDDDDDDEGPDED